jgi:hypothetical protein
MPKRSFRNRDFFELPPSDEAFIGNFLQMPEHDIIRRLFPEKQQRKLMRAATLNEAPVLDSLTTAGLAGASEFLTPTSTAGVLSSSGVVNESSTEEELSKATSNSQNAPVITIALASPPSELASNIQLGSGLASQQSFLDVSYRNPSIPSTPSSRATLSPEWHSALDSLGSSASPKGKEDNYQLNVSQLTERLFSLNADTSWASRVHEPILPLLNNDSTSTMESTGLVRSGHSSPHRAKPYAKAGDTRQPTDTVPPWGADTAYTGHPAHFQDPGGPHFHGR